VRPKLHTDTCLGYAAKTGKAYCIAECSDSQYEDVDHNGSDWGVPPETQAMRDARIRRETIEECAKVCDEENASRLALHRYATAAGALCCADRIRALLTLDSKERKKERRGQMNRSDRTCNHDRPFGSCIYCLFVQKENKRRAEEAQAMRDVRRETVEECAQIVLREARRLRDEGDEYDQLIVEKLLVLAEAILK